MNPNPGWISLHGRRFYYFVTIFAIWTSLPNEAGGQMTRVFQMQESAMTNLSNAITIDRNFWVSSGAVNQGKLTDTSHLSRIQMDIIITSALTVTSPTFPQVSLTQSVQIKDEYKDMPELYVEISAMLLNNVSNVNSMDITIVSEVHSGLDVKSMQGFPMNWNRQLAWNYSRMKNFTVGYTATPNGQSKLIYRTNFDIRDSQQRLLNDFYQPVSAFFCLNKIEILKQDYVHGYNMLMCLAGFILALILMALLAVIRLICVDNAVSHESYESYYHDKGNYTEMLLVTPTVYTGSYQYAFQQHKKTDTSIVNVLIMDRTKVDREIIYRNLSSTEKLENDMEKSWREGSAEIILSLLRKMENERHISKESARKTAENFRLEIAEMEKRLAESYQAKLTELKKTISVRNQKGIAEFKAKSEKIIREAKENNCKPEVIAMLEEEEEYKLQNLIALLQLKEREELASLNKDTDLERRTNYKNTQRNMLQLMRENSDLDTERQEWFMRENAKRQKEWTDEVEQSINSLQLALEEKLSKQEALAKQIDAQDLDNGELLDRIATQQISILKKFKKERIIPDDEVKNLTEEVMDNLKEVKTNYDESKLKRAKELDEKLSREKTATLDEIRAKHKIELEELEKRYKKDLQEGKADAFEHMKEKQKLESHHDLVLVEAESEMDVKHAHLLQDMREKLLKETKIQLEMKQAEMIDKLKEKGFNKESVENMLQIHRQTIATLEQEQLQNQNKQNNAMMERLARLKEERKKKAELEKESQKQVQEFEGNLVKELIDNQLTMSENNRDKILEEHEKQMTKLDNSLTVNKIRQQQLLEEKLAKKREEKMSRLREKQAFERLAKRPTSEDATEEADDSALIEKHAKERLAVLQESENRSSALEEIEISLNKERAEAIKQQEEEMGAMVAKLKLEKIKETCEIEQNERAILKLKANLIDELHSTGVLEDSQCKDILDEHNEQRKAYRQQQEDEIKKQQDILQENLQKRMLKRQETMVEKHEAEMKYAFKNSKDNVASRMKKLVLKNKQMMEREKFRNEMEHKMNQLLEEARQKNELEIKKQLQEKELQLITKLIKMGKLKRIEIEKVMKMLLPGKSPEEIAEMLNKTIGKDTDDSAQRKVSFPSSLELRVREFFLEEKDPLDPERLNIEKRKSKMNDVSDTNPEVKNNTLEVRNNLQYGDDGVYSGENYSNFLHPYNGHNGLYARIDPTTTVNNSDIQTDGMNRLTQLPPMRLSPLEDTEMTPKRKKKKKKLKKALEDSEI